MITWQITRTRSPSAYTQSFFSSSFSESISAGGGGGISNSSTQSDSSTIIQNPTSASADYVYRSGATLAGPDEGGTTESFRGVTFTADQTASGLTSTTSFTENYTSTGGVLIQNGGGDSTTEGGLILRSYNVSTSATETSVAEHNTTSMVNTTTSFWTVVDGFAFTSSFTTNAMSNASSYTTTVFALPNNLDTTYISFFTKTVSDTFTTRTGATVITTDILDVGIALSTDRTDGWLWTFKASVSSITSFNSTQQWFTDIASSVTSFPAEFYPQKRSSEVDYASFTNDDSTNEFTSSNPSTSFAVGTVESTTTIPSTSTYEITTGNNFSRSTLTTSYVTFKSIYYTHSTNSNSMMLVGKTTSFSTTCVTVGESIRKSFISYYDSTNYITLTLSNSSFLYSNSTTMTLQPNFLAGGSFMDNTTPNFFYSSTASRGQSSTAMNIFYVGVSSYLYDPTYFEDSWSQGAFAKPGELGDIVTNLSFVGESDIPYPFTASISQGVITPIKINTTTTRAGTTYSYSWSGNILKITKSWTQGDPSSVTTSSTEGSMQGIGTATLGADEGFDGLCLLGGKPVVGISDKLSYGRGAIIGTSINSAGTTTYKEIRTQNSSTLVTDTTMLQVEETSPAYITAAMFQGGSSDTFSLPTMTFERHSYNSLSEYLEFL